MESSNCIQVIRQEERKWSELSCDVLEVIFSSLPDASVVRAATVCKRWYSVVEKSTFSEFYRKKHLNGNSVSKFVYGGNDLNYHFSVHFDSQEGFRFQQVERVFNVPTFPCSEDGNVPTIEVAGGLHLAFTGLTETTLRYKLSLIEKKWRTTPPMPNVLQDPVVGVVHGSNDSNHKLVVAGGSSFYSEDDVDLAVWIFDCQTDSWECCDPLPSAFRGCTSSLFMSAVVHKGRFYAYDMYSGLVSLLDLDTKRWSTMVNLRPSAKGTQMYLVSQSEALRLVGVQKASEWDLSFTVWNVMDEFEETMRVGESLHNMVVLNACGTPPSSISRWASSSMRTSMKVASSSFTVLSNLVGVMFLLLVQFVIFNCTVTRRGVCFLRDVISSIVTIVRKNHSRRMQTRYPGGGF